ncbi:MAG TPA: SDR family oxidoreductase, partial [Methylovorus sp.]|nr:SDR family oxidoreductase [Methylovorus sp.]
MPTDQQLSGTSDHDHRNMQQPAQQQHQQPGREEDMEPRPQYIDPGYKASEKLKGKVALISGGDSGIGRAVAVHFAAEGANVGIIYYTDAEEEDAYKTLDILSDYGVYGEVFQGDISDVDFCSQVVQQVMDKFGRLDIVVNNAAQQFEQSSLKDIAPAQLEQTFKVNVFGMFYLTQAALPHLKEGSRIINTASVTAYKGNPVLLDYSATKGAIVAFTRSLSQQLSEQGITVNAVAPGPIWTPLIPASFSAEKVEKFGHDTPMGRPGQPSEVAPAYVFLASNDGSYISGQVIHPNGGTSING